MGVDTDFEALRSFGLAFPEAEEDFPWGHTAIKASADRDGSAAASRRQRSRTWTF